jgi:hypothetical protein
VQTYFKQCNIETFVQYITRKKLARLPTKGPKTIKEELLEAATKILANYRQECAKNSPPS